ncbi:hypothetical protein GIB67_036806 [Kingdonia uniflora]|uniref:Uncharacterized protein n=1 Tax=Kingdonia uniflora TaxID=39325 RepID=A0A7J7LWV9_9MAGN|nr:hypothetical protein GIB67_036806 [Kingdonia uniflora]
MKGMLYLQQFPLIIQYKKGVDNKMANRLSRPPLLTTSVIVVSMQIQPFVTSGYVAGYDDPKRRSVFS